MEQREAWITYPSSITDIAEANSSFDSCKIRVCYTGANRNGSSISEAAIEAAISSIYNIPIVCNYSIEDDAIGGHDVSVVKTDRGIKLVNLTDAVGVIPAGAQCYWEDIEEGGESHHYFCVDGLLWKRSSAYEKIKADGITAQSMEISVSESHKDDGVLHIDRFEFAALCLLGDGIEPCFEGAALEAFCLPAYKSSFALMASDLKEMYAQVTASKTAAANNLDVEGGKEPLKIDELLAKYNLTSEDITYSLDGLSETEIEQMFAEIADKKTNDGSEAEPESYALNINVENEIRNQLKDKRWYNPRWDEACPMYYFLGYDADAAQVYVEDTRNGELYGIPYSMDGDAVILDFTGMKRKKIEYVDFDEGTNAGGRLFSYEDEELNARLDALSGELAELREFKVITEAARQNAEIDEVFGLFEDLVGNTAFEELRANHDGMNREAIENACYALRGRTMTVKFSTEAPKPIRLPVENHEPVSTEPYGGVFLKYGIVNK